MNWALRLLTAAGLLVDAVVHLRLAGEYQFAYPDGIGGGNLFRIEAGVALVSALAVIVWGGRRRQVWLGAFVVAFSALVAVVLTRYIEVPGLGPIPAMYEPVWFAEKTLSAVAEGVAALAAAVGTSRLGPSRDPDRTEQ